MKFLLFIFYLVYVPAMIGQKTYTSPVSEHFPTGRAELLLREIEIYESKIIIKTSIDENQKDILELEIVSIIHNEEDPENYLVYNCVSKDGKYPSTVIIPFYQS